MSKKIKVKSGCTFPSPVTWPSTKISDGTEELAITGSVDGCSVMPKIRFVGNGMRVDNTRVFVPSAKLSERGQSLMSNRL